MTFSDKLKNKWDENKFVCVGLDADFSRIPHIFKDGRSISEAIFEFNKSIVDATDDLVCAYKPNCAFYESQGLEGRKALEQTVEYIKSIDPDIVLILDAKRADIGNSNQGYVKDVFDNLGFDAVTVHPYLGKEAIQPFLDRKDRGIIVLVRTSNAGSGELQDLVVSPNNLPLYQVIAQKVARDWNTNGNCAVVVGATYPEELKKVREIVGDMPILIPGIGAQSGDLENTVKNGLNSKKQGIIICSSRAIIFAPNPREAALKLHQEILLSLRGA